MRDHLTGHPDQALIESAITGDPRFDRISAGKMTWWWPAEALAARGR